MGTVDRVTPRPLNLCSLSQMGKEGKNLLGWLDHWARARVGTKASLPPVLCAPLELKVVLMDQHL